MKRKLVTLITCEHASNAVPVEFRSRFRGSSRVLSSHRGWDAGARIVAESLSRSLRAPLYMGKFTRLAVDLNRSAHHRKLFSEYTSELSETEKHTLLEKYYYPYRNAVETQIAKSLRIKNTTVLHLSVHSCTPVLNGVTRDVDLGLLFDPKSHSEKKFGRTLKVHLLANQADLNVRFNYPYLGYADALTTHLRKLFSHDDYIGIELEFNQAFLLPWLKSPRKNLLTSLLASSIQATCGTYLTLSNSK